MNTEVHEYYDADVERHFIAVRSAISQKQQKDCTELFLFVKGDLKYARRILTRGPLAAGEGVFNIPEKDKRVFDDLRSCGYDVYLHCWDEASDKFEIVTYDSDDWEWLSGKQNQSNYYQREVSFKK